MPRTGTWSVAAAVSVAIHATVAGGLAVYLRPDPLPQQSPPTASIELAAETVRQSRANEGTPKSQPVAERAAETTPLAQDVPRRTSAAAQDPRVERLSAGELSPVLPAALVGEGKAIAAVDLPISRTDAVEPGATAAKAAPLHGQEIRSDASRPTRVDTITPELGASAAIEAPVTATMAIEQRTRPAPAATVSIPEATIRPTIRRPDTAEAFIPSSQIVRTGLIDATSLTPAVSPSNRPALSETLSAPKAYAPAPIMRPLVETPASDGATRQTAALAWTVGGSTLADPVSLAAIQAFMQPQSLENATASPVRDGLGALLTSIPCSRLQTEFSPETGSLELRGHVPNKDMVVPLLKALQAQLGTGIPVSDETLILPAPQCGALAGIATIGLPQSDDQRTNPRIVGENAHVREFRYQEGDNLTLDLTAPDYDAYVYIDYFDSAGTVLHLQPNEIVPLEPVSAKSQLTVGSDASGRKSLALTIAPPFGQEIVVAFATSEPLYDGLRPIREPADEYLDLIRERVSLVRDRHSDFKGEWVYFIISTRARDSN